MDTLLVSVVLDGTVGLDFHDEITRNRTSGGVFRNLNLYISGVHFQKCSKFSRFFSATHDVRAISLTKWEGQAQDRPR